MSDPSTNHRWRRRLIWLGVIGAVLAAVGYALASAVDNVREAAERSSCNLGGVAMAFHNYQEDHGHLPPAIVRASDGTPLHSWRVLLLPYIEEDSLYKEFRLDEPWDSPHNIHLLPRMPRSYQPPGRQAAKIPPHHTVLHVFVGKGTPFEEGRKLRINNGGEQTLLFVEAGEAVPWTMPHELSYDAERPLPPLRPLFRNGFRSCLVGCSYHFISNNTPETDLRELITRKGMLSADTDR